MRTGEPEIPRLTTSTGIGLTHRYDAEVHLNVDGPGRDDQFDERGVDGDSHESRLTGDYKSECRRRGGLSVVGDSDLSGAGIGFRLKVNEAELVWLKLICKDVETL